MSTPIDPRVRDQFRPGKRKSPRTPKTKTEKLVQQLIVTCSKCGVTFFSVKRPKGYVCPSCNNAYSPNVDKAPI